MTTRKQAYDDVINEAVADLAEHGFSSAERVAYWEVRIRKAAEDFLGTASNMDEMLREVLAATYKKMVERGGIATYHPGVPRWTLEKVKPSLRAELDRRIMASANLIRLNRKQAIEKTLARFSGWSTSLPAGGSAEPEKRETKARLKKPLAQLKFEERRVLTDQGHKLISALNDIVAVDGGAIGGFWRSHYRQPGYDYRPDHKDRDGNFYAVRGSWAIEKGLIRKGYGYTDEITRPAEEPFCFPGDSNVPFAGLVEKAFRRAYDGDLITITTSSGKSLRATPNHPILTTRGWRPAGMLDETYDLIEIADHLVEPLEENKNDRCISSIADIFGALSENGIVDATNDRAANFHGDGSDGQVDIVHAAGGLLVDFVTARPKGVRKLLFAVSEVVSAFRRAFDFSRLFLFLAADRVVRGASQSATTFDAFAGHSNFASVGTGSRFDTARLEVLDDYGSRNAPIFRDSEDAHSAFKVGADRFDVELNLIALRKFAEIEAFVRQTLKKSARFKPDLDGDFPEGFPFATQAANVVKIERSRFTGHVYNLQTSVGWYAVSGIITHNCRCFYRYVYNLRDVPKEFLTRKGEAALAEAQAKIRGMVS